MAHGSPIPEGVPTPTGGGGGGGGTDFDRCIAGGGSAAFCAAQFPGGGGSDITGSAPPGSVWVAAGAGLQNLVGPDGTIFATRSVPTGGSGAAAPTQFESQRQLDLAQAKATLDQAQAALQNAQTSRDQLEIQKKQLDLQKAQFDFDKIQAGITNLLASDTLKASIAATKQRLEEIQKEADLALRNQDFLLTKRLEAEKEMLTLRLDNDFRELLFSEIGAERRTLIQEQGETRRLVAQSLGKDEFRAAALLGGQAQRGRTPAQLFGQQNQAFLNQPLPQGNFSAPFPTGGAGTGDPAIRAQALAGLQAQLTGAQNRPLQPQAPVAGLAGGGVIEMGRGSNGAFSMKPQSFFVGEVGGRVIPGITEIMTVGDGKVTVTPLAGGFQLGGGVKISPSDLPPVGAIDRNAEGIEVGTFNTINPFSDRGDVEDARTTFINLLISFGVDEKVARDLFDLSLADANLLLRDLVTQFNIPHQDFNTAFLLLEDAFGPQPPGPDTLPPGVEPEPAPPPPGPPPVEAPAPPPAPPGPVGPSPQDILAGLQALAPGFAGLTEFVPRTQTGQFGGTNALRDFFSLNGQNLVQDPFSGQFRPFLPGLPEGVNPTALQGAPTSFGAPVVNQGAFNLQNLATLGFDPSLVRLGGQEDIFYRDPTTGELRQFGTPDIFEQSGFNLQDVFNISPTGQNFQFGNPITSPLPLDPNSNTSGPFRMPIIDSLTGALLFDPFQNASSLLQLFQSNPSAFNNLISSFGAARTGGLSPEGFQSRLDLATPTGALDNPQRIGFTGTRL